MPQTITRTCTVDVQITISDDAPPDLLTRGQTDEFRKHLYSDLDSEEAVIEHFAANCAGNGITDVSRLDGWADVPAGAVVMWVASVTAVQP